MGLSFRIRLRERILEVGRKMKVAYHDAFDASNLNELKNKIVEHEINEC
jgi:hypothetical protein